MVGVVPESYCGKFVDFKKLWPQLPGPKGWLRQEEAKELYRLAKNGPREGVIVEIGSWQGRSTITLARGMMQGDYTPIYSVDPHRDTYAHRKHATPQTESVFRHNLERLNVDSFVTPIVALSTDAVKTWTEPIRLLWIDGHHDYPLIDYLLWEPFVVEGGTIALHDIDHYGARKVVRHFLKDSEKFVRARKIVYSMFAEKAWPPQPFTPQCSWELLFVTANQWLNLITRNEDAHKPWHSKLPYLWWRHMSKARFLQELPHHLHPFKESLWFLWEPIIKPIPRKEAGNYKM